MGKPASCIRPPPRMTASMSGIKKAMWFNALLSVSPSATLWWSLLQRMKAMMRVRSDIEKSKAASMNLRVSST